MPNIRSAKKRMRSNARRADVNKLINGSMKTAIKKFEKSAKDGDKEQSKTNLNIALQRIDKACKSGQVHKNKAARLKSRLTKTLNSME